MPSLPGPPPPEGTSWPPPGDPGTTVLRPPTGAGAYLKFLLVWSPVLAILFVVLLLLASIPFETMAAGTGTPAGTAVGAAGVLIAAGTLLYKKHRAQTGTQVIVSPTGVEVRDVMGFEVRLRWADVTAVGTVRDQQTARQPIRARGNGVRLKTPVAVSEGLIGWGERVVSRRAPLWMHEHLAAQPRNPHTGQQSVAVSFSAAGTPGFGNPLLQITRHYRPDLVR